VPSPGALAGPGDGLGETERLVGVVAALDLHQAVQVLPVVGEAEVPAAEAKTAAEQQPADRVPAPPSRAPTPAAIASFPAPLSTSRRPISPM
jgi:hypothetical protein